MDDVAAKALAGAGVDLNKVINCEADAALGNGGPRPSGCLLPRFPGNPRISRLRLRDPLRVRLFNQRIENGQQIERPENWLRYGNPWEFERPNVIYPVRFGGRILCFKDSNGRQQCHWVDTEDVIAMAYDMPISGYNSKAVTNLRVWSARSTREFDLRDFNEGNLRRGGPREDPVGKTCRRCSIPTTPPSRARSCGSSRSTSSSAPRCRTSCPASPSIMAIWR